MLEGINLIPEDEIASKDFQQDKIQSQSQRYKLKVCLAHEIIKEAIQVIAAVKAQIEADNNFLIVRNLQ